VKALKFGLFFLTLLLLSACGDTVDEPTSTPMAERTPAESSPGEATSNEAAQTPAATETSSSQASDGVAGTTAEPEEIAIEGAEGLTIQGTLYPGAGDGPRPGVLLLHMNGRTRDDWDDFARQLAGSGYTALAIDMRGHGDTGGGRDWDLAAEDLQSVWAAFTGREDIQGSQTAIIGASIGANMALVTAAAEPAVKSVALLSPGRDYFGVTTEDRIIEYGSRPIMIVASEEDTEAAASSRALHELATDEASLITYEGAGHGTNMLENEPELAGRLIDWLDQTTRSSVAEEGNQGATVLLGLDWDDRSPFRPGLIDAEVDVLDQLPGASVYQMDLAIAPDLRSVSGQQEVRYTNQEDVALQEIYFHLFPNLLGGSIEVSDLTVDGQPAEAEYQAQNAVMRVPLATPLAPGEQAIIRMNFEVEVPTEGGSNYGVFATIDDVLALAHFYPQIAVYDDEGWNIDVPPPNADVTYADSSFYLVQVTAPAEQVIVTSGIEIGDSTAGAEQQLLVAAGPTRDFYLASSDRYTVVSQQVGETTVNSYGFPEFTMQNKQALSYAVGALESMGDRFGPYPYTEFDVAPTPNQALGVEYPGATVIRAELYDPDLQFGELPASSLMEGTVAHEVGHQWFYSTVGNDQLDEPWVDESLTQYITYLYFLDTYGPEAAQGFRQSFVDRWQRVEMADIPIGMPAGNYSGREYSAIVYGRGPLFFERLAEEMGQGTFDEFLRDYYQQNKWGIATGAELKSLAEAHCDCDLTALFAEWVGEQ